MSYLQVLGALLLIAAAAFVWRFVRKRSRWARAAGILSMIGFGIASAGLTLSFLFSHLMCGEYLLPPVVSIDKGAVAQVTEFDCGAATPFTSTVRVRSGRFVTAHWGLNRWYTVFTAEVDPRVVTVKWTGPQELTIRYPVPYRHPEYLKCDSAWRDITIRCQSYNPDERTPLPQLPEPNRWAW
jgi:hypothetical protein